MNQEKIMKAKMVAAILAGLTAVLVMLIFIGLYADERVKTQQRFHDQYIENLCSACEEIRTYQDTGIDLELHYNMLLSDLGAVRTLAFLTEDLSEEKKKTINTFHYCLVKYPEQMQGRLEEILTAMDDVSAELDKGYAEMDDIANAIDKMGN